MQENRLKSPYGTKDLVAEQKSTAPNEENRDQHGPPVVQTKIHELYQHRGQEYPSLGIGSERRIRQNGSPTKNHDGHHGVDQKSPSKIELLFPVDETLGSAIGHARRPPDFYNYTTMLILRDSLSY